MPSRKRIGRMETAQSLYDQTVERITSLKWPRWPILPMKKRNPSGGFPDLGFLHADNARDADGVKLYGTDIHSFAEMTIEQRKAVAVTEFATVDALLAAGWEID